MRAERLMAAVPDRVMRALTAPGELTRWACEEALVDAATYRLTGPALPGGFLGGQLLERTDRLLRFAWPLGDSQESRVEIVVTAEHQTKNPPADFARVVIVHTGIPENALPEAKWQAESWECIWTLWLRQLQLWVERAEAPGRFDFTGPAGLRVERHLTMDAKPERVWQAIADPALRQRWLTVELGAELHRTEGREIAFAFSLGGATTTVTWTLEPVAGGSKTLVIIREEGISEGVWDNQLGWHDYLVALYQETARPLIRQTEWIKAPPERVWPHVSTQEGLRRWFSANMRFEPKVGGQWATEAHGGKLAGRVTVMEPPHRLAFTWTEPGMGWPEPEPLLITLDLAPENGGTRVVLTHAGFENLPEAIRGHEFGGYQRGWAPGDSLVELKHIIEGEGLEHADEV